jgi:ethanolamine utilization protein EutN
MFVGRVIGSVWATVKWPEVHGLKLLSVQPYHLSDLAHGGESAPSSHDLVVCADVLDAGVGDDVVIAYGHAARVAVSEQLGPTEKPSIPIDAAVVAVVDRWDLDRGAVELARRGESDHLEEVVEDQESR